MLSEGSRFLDSRIPVGVRFLGASWFGMTLYGMLRAATSAHLHIMQLLAGFVMLIASGALMERMRWARMTLIGIAAAIPCSQVWKIMVEQPRETGAWGGHVSFSALNALGEHTLFGTLLMSLCGLTLVLLLWQPVRRTFGRRRPQRDTTSAQYVIATLFLLVWMSGRWHGSLYGACGCDHQGAFLMASAPSMTVKPLTPVAAVEAARPLDEEEMPEDFLSSGEPDEEE